MTSYSKLVLLCLTYLSRMCSRPIHLLKMAEFLSCFSSFSDGWVIPHCVYIPCPFLSVHLLMDTWVVSVSWLLQIVLQWIWEWVHKKVEGHMNRLLTHYEWKSKDIKIGERETVCRVLSNFVLFLVTIFIFKKMFNWRIIVLQCCVCFCLTMTQIKIWNTSGVSMSPLHRGHTNLLCIIPILVYMLPKQPHFIFLTWAD